MLFVEPAFMAKRFSKACLLENNSFPFSKIIDVSILNICEQVLVDPGLVAKSFSHVASSAGLSYNRAIYEDWYPAPKTCHV